MTPSSALGVGGVIIAILLAAGCDTERASAENCRQILDRIVDIELAEQGFRDPVFAAGKREDLRRILTPELKTCAGRKLPPAALTCVRDARSTEEISHRCLR